MRHQQPPAPLEEAEAFLRDLLAQGPVPAEVVLAQARQAGIVPHVLYQAKWALGVSVTVKDGKEMWS